jgi:hypothetical protein
MQGRGLDLTVAWAVNAMLLCAVLGRQLVLCTVSEGERRGGVLSLRGPAGQRGRGLGFHYGGFDHSWSHGTIHKAVKKELSIGPTIKGGEEVPSSTHPMTDMELRFHGTG